MHSMYNLKCVGVCVCALHWTGRDPYTRATALRVPSG